MAITVKHKFVSAIPDGPDATIVRPSNWNDTHELTGLGTMAEQNANAVAITGGTISGVAITGYVPTTETITAGTGLTGGGDLSAPRTIALANTAVTTGTYGNAARTITQTVDQQGRLTNIFDQPIEIANTQVTGLGTASTKDAGVALGVATLDAAGKVPLSEIPDSIIGALSYQGTWNATTNTPTLISSVGVKGYYYVVSVAGTTNLNGITDWQIGDWAVFDGLIWEKIDNTDGVTSVNGFTGAVVLTTTNIAEGTNLYYTDARARAAISAGTGLSYNSTTGAMNFSDSAVATWAATPTSAHLKSAMTDETGSGALVFADGPTLSAPVIDGANPYIRFLNGSAVTSAAGRLWYNGNDGSLNFGMGGGNITQQIGEELFVYGKASAAITDSPLQIVYKTGTVGASGVITFAPAVGSITNSELFVGCATEAIALNDFGRVTCFGSIHGIDTTGAAYGETWAANDVIWYNPANGNPTKTKPSAPNIKVQLGYVINVSATLGTFHVEILHGSELGGTDSNVQLSSPTAAQLLTYSTTDSYWKNTNLAAGTGISVGNAASGVITVTNSAPDQTVVLSNGTGISVSGTYPNFTITNTAPSSGGTVTSVSGTTGRITSTGGTTPVIDLASGVATAGTTGSATLIPVITIDTYGRVTSITTAANPQGTVTSVGGTGTVNGLTLTGTVTSSGNLTLGGTLDLSSPPAIGGTAANTITGTTITATKFVGVSGGTF